MKAASVVVASALLAASSFSAWAADTPVDKPAPIIDSAAISEMVELYRSFCLDAFPDGAAIDQLASSKGATALTPEQTKIYLNENPGRGWFFRTPAALYAVTVATPPAGICTLRRMTPGGFDTVEPYLAAQQAYAARKKGQFVPARTSQTAPTLARGRARGGPRAQSSVSAIPGVTIIEQLMYPDDGKAAESFILYFINYNFRIPEDWKAEAQGFSGVEVRMVHQLLASPKP